MKSGASRGKTGMYGMTAAESAKMRQAESAPLNIQDFGWLYDRIFECCAQANASYKLSVLDTLTDEVQIVKYAKGDFLRMHRDNGVGYTANRAISAVVMLSAPEEYEAGELMMELARDDATRAPICRPAPQEQGTVLVFPSNLQHEVLPVANGVRYSIVAWVAKGQPESFLKKLKKRIGLGAG